MKAGPRGSGGESISPFDVDNVDLGDEDEDADDEGIEGIPVGEEGERIGAEKELSLIHI